MIYWFTGQPGAGKTTLAKHLVAFLTNTGKVLHIDGDDLRDIFKNKDYSEAGRRRNIERAQDIALFMNEKGHDVVVSFVSPYRDQREEFKDKSEAVEIYVHTTEERGREKFHVLDYEKPEENFVDVDTTNVSDVESFIDLIKRIDL
jgi:adenylylsulfate kinase-like enzyme